MNLSENLEKLKILGISLLKIDLTNLKGKFKIVFKKGIDAALVQNIYELYKNDIREKINGNSIFPIENYTVFINYFRDKLHNVFLIIYLDEKESKLTYSQFYLHSRIILKSILNATNDNETTKLCNDSIEIPKAEGVTGLFIVDKGGCPLLTKINKDREDIKKIDVQIGGFISALLLFAPNIIGEETGGMLKEIDFESKKFHIIEKKKVTFIFMIDKTTSLNKRYMQILTEEFLIKFQEKLENFDGDISQFNNFEEVVNNYFII